MPSGRIIFFSEDVDFKPAQPIRLRRWLRRVVEAEGKSVNELTYVFCSDEYLHRINLEFLNHDTLTDIITFDTSAAGENELSGEFYISVERVTDNARRFEVAVGHEMARVMVHGILHLCGHNDKSERERSKIRQLENFFLQSL